jgi:hypothetical protein
VLSIVKLLDETDTNEQEIPYCSVKNCLLCSWHNNMDKMCLVPIIYTFW